MSIYFKQLQDVLKSDEFKDTLEKINNNFPNLKQEHLIRDVILTLYNQRYSSDYKAFSEHPRLWKLSNGIEKKGRVDLSLCQSSSVNELYRIEMKFNFTKDIKKGYFESIKKEYVSKECNLLMIIVQEFLDVKAKEEYDTKWGIGTNLLKYQNGKNLEEKQDYITSKDNFKKLEDQLKDARSGRYHDKIQIEVQLPYKTRYTFCFLERNRYRIIRSYVHFVEIQQSDMLNF